MAAPGVTVVDDGTIPTAAAGSTWTTRARARRGRCSSRTASCAGTCRTGSTAAHGDGATGNGRREGYASIPMPRMTNTFMLAGPGRPDGHHPLRAPGLYAKNFGGGQVDITNGKFVFSASEAYLIEDGKIGAPVSARR